jgi:hypothetical protein
MSGNDSPVLDGYFCPFGHVCENCTVLDLCAPGWHPCQSNLEVAKRSPTGCEGILPPGENGFFIAMTGASEDDGACGAGKHNDLHGCGNLGQPESELCAPLTRRMSSADCASAGGGWRCDSKDNHNEADTVTKTKSELGGVLCCRNLP